MKKLYTLILSILIHYSYAQTQVSLIENELRRTYITYCAPSNYTTTNVVFELSKAHEENGEYIVYGIYAVTSYYGTDPSLTPDSELKKITLFRAKINKVLDTYKVTTIENLYEDKEKGIKDMEGKCIYSSEGKCK